MPSDYGFETEEERSKKLEEAAIRSAKFAIREKSNAIKDLVLGILTDFQRAYGNFDAYQNYDTVRFIEEKFDKDPNTHNTYWRIIIFDVVVHKNWKYLRERVSALSENERYAHVDLYIYVYPISDTQPDHHMLINYSEVAQIDRYEEGMVKLVEVLNTEINRHHPNFDMIVESSGDLPLDPTSHIGVLRFGKGWNDPITLGDKAEMERELWEA